MKLYPIHLLLERKKALVVGGGPVAAIKAKALLQGGAQVKAIAPSFSEEMKNLIEGYSLEAELREFVSQDLDSVWIVVAATDNPEVQEKVFEESSNRNLLVCIVDDPSRSNFIVPAVLRRGDLMVTVSTSGTAPALASRVRDYLAEIIGEEYGRVLGQLRHVRQELRDRYPDFAQRRKAWYRLIDNEVLPALRRGAVPHLEGYDGKDLEGIE